MDDEIYYTDTFDNLEKMDTFMKKYLTKNNPRT